MFASKQEKIPNRFLCVVTASMLLILSMSPGITNAETFTLVQATSAPSPLNWVTGLTYHEERNEFYMYSAGNSNLFVLDIEGFIIDSYNPGFSDSSFRHTGMTIDPVNKNVLLLRDLKPGVFGPGSQLYTVDPDSKNGYMVVDLSTVTPVGEPMGLALNPFNSNILIAQTFSSGVGQGNIVEVTPAGDFVRLVVSPEQLGDLGLNFATGGMEIFPLTNELIIAGSGGPNAGVLFAVDLETLAIRNFYDTGLEGVYSDGPTDITFNSSGDMAISTRYNLYLYDGNGDQAFAPTPDSDYDGVIDNEDSCLETAPEEVVDIDGCSISQICPCDNNWRNHGKYVACVAHISEDFVIEGLITDEEKDIIVSFTAQSDCGKKKQ